MSNPGCSLASFASFAAARNDTHGLSATAITWAGQARSVANRDEPVGHCLSAQAVLPKP